MSPGGRSRTTCIYLRRFLGRICTIYAGHAHYLTTVGEEPDDLDHDLSASAHHMIYIMIYLICLLDNLDHDLSEQSTR